MSTSALTTLASFTQRHCLCAFAFAMLGRKPGLCVCWTLFHQWATHSPHDYFSSCSVTSGRHRGDNVSSLQRALPVRDGWLGHPQRELGAPPRTKTRKAWSPHFSRQTDTLCGSEGKELPTVVTGGVTQMRAQEPCLLAPWAPLQREL